MLPFANAMFLDILHEDGLIIAAKGLGIEEVFYSLLRVYSDPGNLVNTFSDVNGSFHLNDTSEVFRSNTKSRKIDVKDFLSRICIYNSWHGYSL